MVKEQILESIPVGCDSNYSHDYKGDDDQTDPNRKVGYGHHPPQVEARFSLRRACHKKTHHEQRELNDAQVFGPHDRGRVFLIHFKVVKDDVVQEKSDKEWGENQVEQVKQDHLCVQEVLLAWFGL